MFNGLQKVSAHKASRERSPSLRRHSIDSTTCGTSKGMSPSGDPDRPLLLRSHECIDHEERTVQRRTQMRTNPFRQGKTAVAEQDRRSSKTTAQTSSDSFAKAYSYDNTKGNLCLVERPDFLPRSSRDKRGANQRSLFCKNFERRKRQEVQKSKYDEHKKVLDVTSTRRE